MSRVRLCHGNQTFPKGVLNHGCDSLIFLVIGGEITAKETHQLSDKYAHDAGQIRKENSGKEKLPEVVEYTVNQSV